jgi:SPP1 family predicted phage head-tail adaptor
MITLQNRAITPPVFDGIDFSETFTDAAEVWALINTISGKTFFDGVGTEINITHEIYIRYDSTVTSETWIEFNGRRFDILQTEDLEERNEFMRLTCTDRGSNTASQA